MRVGRQSWVTSEAAQCSRKCAGTYPADRRSSAASPKPDLPRVPALGLSAGAIRSASRRRARGAQNVGPQVSKTLARV